MKNSLCAATAVAALLVAAVATTVPHSAQPLAAAQAAVAPGRQAQLLGTVNMARLAAGPHANAPAAKRYIIEADHHNVAAALQPRAALGGSSAPGATVQSGGGGASGFNGVNILEMEKAGTGKWAGTNGGLEPPDQALCVGNGYVLEGVNTAWKVYSTTGAPLTPAVPITQFFNIAPGGQATPPSS